MPPKQGAGGSNYVLQMNSRSGNVPYKYPTNYIRTTQYTLLSFLPMNMMQQFKKMSNVFFFVNMVIALVPGVSPVFPATTILPLVVVLAVAAAKDAYEDIQRYHADQRANAVKVKLVEPTGRINENCQSKDVHVGDVLYLERGSEIPVDCIILSTALEDGSCFVETANLDGETNIKPKQAKMLYQRKFSTPESMTRFSGTIACDAPNDSLHKWLGKISVPEVGEQSVDIDNFLLRGCTVRNIDWVIAVTVYTGVNTKLFLNLIQKPPKNSRLDEKLNRLILMILAVQQIIIIIQCAFFVSFSASPAANGFYVEYFYTGKNVVGQFFMTYMTYFVLLSLMMPISLFVSLEFCKAVQAKMMEWDPEMTNIEKKTGTFQTMTARTSSLNEELSQVQYVFSDKTGTLTENLMRFAEAFSGDQAFDELKKPGEMQKFVNATGKLKVNTTQCANFLRLLVFCNNVVINLNPDGSLSYDGSSTDEVALCDCASKNGYKLLSRSSDSMTVEIQKEVSTVEVITYVPFTPERKMMSVVLREKNGLIRMYTKGADSSVMARLSKDPSKNEPKKMKNAQSFLDRCATEGLRTLACGERVFTEEEFAIWKKQWDEACLTVTGDRGDKVHKAALEGEQFLTFLGCTAIEDKLQDEVPETIHFLLRCGIVVWVLTGDKRETALNIAGTSRLLNPQKDLVIHLDVAILSQHIGDQISSATMQCKEARKRGQKCSFIVDGKSLETIFEKQHFEKFRQLGLLVNSAVCCRVTPLQKARVVKMFQDLGSTCLGVGDGANDVSMIQEARVGIGILGLEGSQAERASDYAIPRFRHLRRLLAVHGRYSLIRNSNLILYSFYKNLVYSFTQCFYSFYNGFTGQTIYDSWVIIFFNMAFTFFPPVVMGIFDFDVRDKFVLRHPGLYAELRSAFAVRMSRVSSWLWFMLSFFHSWVIFYGCYRGVFITDNINEREGGIWYSGTVMMNLMLAVVIFQAMFSFLSWTWAHVLSVFLSFASYTVFVFLYAAVPPTVAFGEYYWVPMVTFGEAKTWLLTMLVFVVLMGAELCVLVIRRGYFGTYMHTARHADYLQKKQLPWTDLGPAAEEKEPVKQQPLTAIEEAQQMLLNEKISKGTFYQSEVNPEII